MKKKNLQEMERERVGMGLLNSNRIGVKKILLNSIWGGGARWTMSLFDLLIGKKLSFQLLNLS